MDQPQVDNESGTDTEHEPATKHAITKEDKQQGICYTMTTTENTTI